MSRGPSVSPGHTGGGLSETEAARRLDARGKPSRQHSSRSYASIIRANTLNIPNGILFFFGVLTIAFASWKDALFLGILLANVVIGSFQEIRSKRALDRLAALVAPDAVVVRDGVDRHVPVDEVVVGDVVRLAAGDQVVADGTVITGDGLALDEANLTGESEPVLRGGGEPVWSGSFAVEGWRCSRPRRSARTAAPRSWPRRRVRFATRALRSSAPMTGCCCGSSRWRCRSRSG